MGLNLSLKPNERIVINGAVIRNPGRHNVEITVETKSVILREKDFMREEDATTPCKRLYYIGMLALLDDENQDKHREDFVSWLGEIMGALRHPIAIAAAAEIADEVAKGNYHRALKGCRHLIDYEDLSLRGAVPADVVEEQAVAA